MKVENWSIDKVEPYDKNPRNNDDAVEATANSIKEFGWQQPIVVDKDGCDYCWPYSIESC